MASDSLPPLQDRSSSNSNSRLAVSVPSPMQGVKVALVHRLAAAAAALVKVDLDPLRVAPSQVDLLARQDPPADSAPLLLAVPVEVVSVARRAAVQRRPLAATLRSHKLDVAEANEVCRPFVRLLFYSLETISIRILAANLWRFVCRIS